MKQKLQKGDKIPYTQVANLVLNDPVLSFKAKGIYSYLYSKDDKYVFAAKRIAKDSNDGRDAVLSGLIELEQAGYISREKLKTGRMIYTINITRIRKAGTGSNPDTDNPTEGKAEKGKSRTITNLDAPTNLDKETNPPLTPQGGKRKRVLEIQNQILPILERKWEENEGDTEKIIDSLGFVLKYGEETINRIPSLISSYLYFQDESPVWKTREDFMASMRNLTRVLANAGVEKVSATAWNAALKKTSVLEYANIKTVINNL